MGLKSMGLFALILLAPILAACGPTGKQSAVEGKLLDWKGRPASGITIVAEQVQPLKGYERIETVTRSDGTFRMRGLFPSSEYELKLSSDLWFFIPEMAVPIASAPQGETLMMPSPITMPRAYWNSNDTVVTNLARTAPRFELSAEKVLHDSETGLEWIRGPNPISAQEAVEWLLDCKVAGGGWLMPNCEELVRLGIDEDGDKNSQPLIQLMLRPPVYSVWADPVTSTGAAVFEFGSLECKTYSYDSVILEVRKPGVFGVRSGAERR